MVMRFGFDRHSKAAVVAIVAFFPVPVNCVTGLAAADVPKRGLVQTCGAGPEPQRGSYEGEGS